VDLVQEFITGISYRDYLLGRSGVAAEVQSCAVAGLQKDAGAVAAFVEIRGRIYAGVKIRRRSRATNGCPHDG